ncbi:MAG TPA: hypothetical protein VGB56_04845 [Flavisolibacter sp.]
MNRNAELKTLIEKRVKQIFLIIIICIISIFLANGIIDAVSNRGMDV